MDFSQILNNIAMSLPGFLLGIAVHEWGHALMAYRFGDDTAKMAGRLTLNPIAHYDLMGTIIFPLIGALSGWMMFGWAKPVPVDPRRFRKVKAGIFWVSFAGPLANLIVALIGSLIVGIMATQVSSTFSLHDPLIKMLVMGIRINIILAAFNLIPFPPLDGSKMVSIFLSYESARKFEDLQRYSILFMLVLWMTPILGYIIRPFLFMGDLMIQTFITMLS